MSVQTEVAHVWRSIQAPDALRFCEVHEPPFVPMMSPALDQVNRLLEAFCPIRRIQLAVLAFTGLRAGELQMLRPEDVDFERNFIHVIARASWMPKNRCSRKVPINVRLLPYLLELPKTSRPYLFCAAPSRTYPNGDHFINIKHLN